MAPRGGGYKARAPNASGGPSSGPGTRGRKRKHVLRTIAPLPAVSFISISEEFPDFIALNDFLAAEQHWPLNLQAQQAPLQTERPPRPLAEGPLPDHAAEQEAQGFDDESERELYMKAEQEALEAAEADEVHQVEEQYEEYLATLGDCDNIEALYLKTTLQQGAEYHVTGIPDTATYEEMVSLQYSAERLAEMCNVAKQELLDKERIRVTEEKGILKRRIEELSALAALQEAEMHALQGTMEEQHNRVICTICFSEFRDCLLLPCMHFQFCSPCVAQHLKLQKTCPICRTPVSGTLQTKLD